MATEGTHPTWELGEDIRSEGRLRQDQIWQEAVADGRVHISHREANQVHASEFKQTILQFELVQCLTRGLNCRQSPLTKLNREILEVIINYSISYQHSLIVHPSSKREELCSNLEAANYYHSIDKVASNITQNFRICVRKRPLNDHEIQENVYDCIKVHKSHYFLTAHDGKKARTGRRIHMDHKHFFFDKVWDETARNSEICSTEIERLIAWARQGLSSTLLCFGQTGTGKTYTLTAAMDFIIHSLSMQSIEITFVEIHGKKCYDLLAKRKVVFLRSDAEDNVHIRGARTIQTDSSPESARLAYMELIDALQLRSCEVTERNPISSRSHAICTIRLLPSPSNDVTDNGLDSEKLNEFLMSSPGKIMLVDLAGSERNYDTVQMSRAQHRESAEINSALMALKGCFRAYQLQVQKLWELHQSQLKPVNESYYLSKVQQKESCSSQLRNLPAEDTALFVAPFRASLLTRILKECFSLDQLHRTLIIATVSPSSVDLMHTVNTLQNVLKMSPRLSSYSSEDTIEVFVRGSAPRDLPISAWSSEHLANWLAYTEGGRFAQLVLPTGVDGQQLMQLSTVDLSTLFEGELRAARRDEEGVAWVEEGVANRGTSALGSLLWRALRREDQAIAQTRAKLLADKNRLE